jgi:hypothetical protein
MRYCPKWKLDVDEEFNCLHCDSYREVECEGVPIDDCTWKEKESDA